MVPAPIDPIIDPADILVRCGPEQTHEVQHRLLDVIRNRDLANRLLKLNDLLPRYNWFGFGLEGRCGAIDDQAFFIARRVVHDNLEEEAIALGFGQRISAFLFDWVLSGQDEERFGQSIRLATDRDFMLLHGFEQGGLGLGWRAVDFVRQEELCKDRPALEDQLAMAGLGDS